MIQYFQLASLLSIEGPIFSGKTDLYITNAKTSKVYPAYFLLIKSQSAISGIAKRIAAI